MILDDDQKLIRRILKGDRPSFEKLMHQYNKRMFNFIYRMVRDEEVAIELTQDFFIKIYSVIQKYNFQYKFSTWAYRICYNLVIDHVRKHPVYVDSLDQNPLTRKQLARTDQVVREDGFSVLAKREMSEYIWNVVERIPEKYKHLILLRYQQGLKYDEIAEITDLPVGTVKNRIFKAKDLIRKEIAQDGMSSQ